MSCLQRRGVTLANQSQAESLIVPGLIKVMTVTVCPWREEHIREAQALNQHHTPSNWTNSNENHRL